MLPRSHGAAVPAAAALPAELLGDILVTRDTNPELWYPTDAAGNVPKFNDLPAEYQANVNTEDVPYDRKLGEQPQLTDDEIDAVVAFLSTLTDR